MYLKRFADSEGNTFEYRLLVSRQKVKQWRPVNISAVGYKRDLYTQSILGTEKDDIEKWLDHDFENPADLVLDKVQSDEELEASDWEILIKFLAAQIVRTPASFIEMQQLWDRIMPAVLQKSMSDVKEKLLRARDTGKPPSNAEPRDRVEIPLRVHREDIPGEGIANITVEVLMGRTCWLNSVKHMATKTVKALLAHQWSILHAWSGMQFFTSDDPVVRLNYHSHSQYDFKGGCRSLAAAGSADNSPPCAQNQNMRQHSSQPTSSSRREEMKIAQHEAKRNAGNAEQQTVASRRAASKPVSPGAESTCQECARSNLSEMCPVYTPQRGTPP
jgi:hypothetical protein